MHRKSSIASSSVYFPLSFAAVSAGASYLPGTGTSYAEYAAFAAAYFIHVIGSLAAWVGTNRRETLFEEGRKC